MDNARDDLPSALNNLPSTLAAYLHRFPGERARLERFALFAQQNAGQQLVSRKNFDGHITGSAFVLNQSRDGVLLIHHRFLDRWLQPGGHVDAGEAPLAAAIREAGEEVGIAPVDLQLLACDGLPSHLPFDIDSHFIPANASKHEASHYHHDFRYLFVYTGSADLVHDQSETKGLLWTSLSSLKDDGEFGATVAKIVAILAR